MQSWVGKGGDIPDRAIGKLHPLHRRAIGRVPVQREFVIGVQRQHYAVAVQRDRHILRTDACAHDHGVDVACGAVDIGDPVQPIAHAEQVAVIAAAAHQRVVATFAIKHVVPSVTGDHVVQRVAGAIDGIAVLLRAKARVEHIAVQHQVLQIGAQGVVVNAVHRVDALVGLLQHGGLQSANGRMPGIGRVRCGE